jgi:hypothetical protein
MTNRESVSGLALVLSLLLSGCGDGVETQSRERVEPSSPSPERTPTPVATTPSREPEKSSPEPTESRPAESPPSCDRKLRSCLERLGGYLADQVGYKGTHRRAFVLSYQICSIFTPKEVAEEFGGSSDPFAAADTYATETYRPEFQIAGRNGCLDGFEGLP